MKFLDTRRYEPGFELTILCLKGYKWNHQATEAFV